MGFENPFKKKKEFTEREKKMGIVAATVLGGAVGLGTVPAIKHISEALEGNHTAVTREAPQQQMKPITQEDGSSVSIDLEKNTLTVHPPKGE